MRHRLLSIALTFTASLFAQGQPMPSPFVTAGASGSLPIWSAYTLTAISNGSNGCINANGCWQVNGVLGANKSAALTQAITLFQLPASGFVSNFRIKSVIACTGTSTLRSGLGTATGPDFFMVSASTGYDLQAVVFATNITTVLPLAVGSTTTAAVNLVANLTSTSGNIDQIAAGCSFTVWILTAILP